MSQKADELVAEILGMLTKKSARFEVKTLEQVVKLLGKKPAATKAPAAGDKRDPSA